VYIFEIYVKFGAHTKRRKTKRRKTKRRKTKRRHDKKSTHQNVDCNKTSTTTKRRIFFLLAAIYRNKYLTSQD
jgi:hypothetical protein